MRGESQQETAVWKGVRSAARLLLLSRQPFGRRLLSFLGTMALPPLQRLPQHLRGWAEAFSCESQCVCWIQMEKPEVWWHLVPVALCAGGQCPVSASRSFIASGMSH